jgi:hypothetical protein
LLPGLSRTLQNIWNEFEACQRNAIVTIRWQAFQGSNVLSALQQNLLKAQRRPPALGLFRSFTDRAPIDESNLMRLFFLSAGLLLGSAVVSLVQAPAYHVTRTVPLEDSLPRSRVLREKFSRLIS